MNSTMNQTRKISFDEKVRRAEMQLLSDIEAVRKHMAFKTVSAQVSQKLANQIFAALSEKPAQTTKPAAVTTARPNFEHLEDTGRGHMTDTGFTYYLTAEENAAANAARAARVAREKERVADALARGLSLDDVF